MKKLLIYCLLLAGLVLGCEDVYNPDIEEMENAIVVDARIVNGIDNNFISLTLTKGFNAESLSYPAVDGAEVFLIDKEGNEYRLPEHESGKFKVNVPLEQDLEYKIRINYLGEVFESAFEKVPITPQLDTVYGVVEQHVYEVGGITDPDDFRKVPGVQLYADISSKTETEKYRFSGYRVLEYIWNEQPPNDAPDIVHYLWTKSDVGGIFNIAAPPEYSSSKEIVKHPLYFFNRRVAMEEDHYMVGWILELYQYALSESSYSYYKDLNAQLDSEGRIFDPVYVQARGNIKCITNPEMLILGNFEISTMTEYRYFIRIVYNDQGYEVRAVDDRSPIAWRGETIDEAPPFWQR